MHEKILINLDSERNGLLNIIPSNTVVTNHMWLIHVRFELIKIWEN